MGTWPNSDAADLESIVRFYLNEEVANFYSQAEIYRWLTASAEDVAQRTFCVKRILNAQTNGEDRFVDTQALKVFYVEYIPSSGRSIMLTQIDPLRIGNYRVKGLTPQYWYEYGSGIHIEPVPNAIYSLRLFVADNPKNIDNISSFTLGTGANEWTAGSGWSVGKPAIHTGGSSDLTYNTVLSEEEYTLEFLVSTVGLGGSVTPHIGTKSGVAISSIGYSTQTIIAAGGNPTLKFTAINDIVIDELRILKRTNISTSTNQTEISATFQHNIALATAAKGLTKNRQNDQAKLLDEINNGELKYLKQSIIDIIPSGRNSMVYS